MRTHITITLDIKLAERLNKHLYKHQLRKGRLIEGLIKTYLDDNSYESLIPLQEDLKTVKPESFN